MIFGRIHSKVKNDGNVKTRMTLPPWDGKGSLIIVIDSLMITVLFNIYSVGRLNVMSMYSPSRTLSRSALSLIGWPLRSRVIDSTGFSVTFEAYDRTSR